MDFLRHTFGDDGSLPTYLHESMNSLGLRTTSGVGDYCAAVTLLGSNEDIIMEKLTTSHIPKVKSVGGVIIELPSQEDFMILGSYVQKRKAEDAASGLIIAT